MSNGERQNLIKDVQSCEEVNFLWRVVAADMSAEVSGILLDMIIDMWVTIRGFSFAKCYMQLYKQREKKMTQCSKGLWKELYTFSLKFDLCRFTIIIPFNTKLIR